MRIEEEVNREGVLEAFQNTVPRKVSQVLKK